MPPISAGPSRRFTRKLRLAAEEEASGLPGATEHRCGLIYCCCIAVVLRCTAVVLPRTAASVAAARNVPTRLCMSSLYCPCCAAFRLAMWWCVAATTACPPPVSVPLPICTATSPSRRCPHHALLSDCTASTHQCTASLVLPDLPYCTAPHRTGTRRWPRWARCCCVGVWGWSPTCLQHLQRSTRRLSWRWRRARGSWLRGTMSWQQRRTGERSEILGGGVEVDVFGLCLGEGREGDAAFWVLFS